MGRKKSFKRLQVPDWPLFVSCMLGPIVFVFTLAYLLHSCSSVATDAVTAQPGYVIEELVPEEVILIEVAKVADSYGRLYPLQGLTGGIKKVSEDFNVKGGLSIVGLVGAHSVTTAVILFVEPKTSAQKVSK